MKRQFLLGALLLAAPLFSQSSPFVSAEPRVHAGKLLWFTLTETHHQVKAKLGQPIMVSESGANWIAWQYRLGTGIDHDEFSHSMLFDRATGRLVSVTRNYTSEHDVSALFPMSHSKVHYFPNAEHAQMAVRVRRLSDGRVLTALGSVGPTSQLAIMRRELMPILFPWVPSF